MYVTISRVSKGYHLDFSILSGLPYALEVLVQGRDGNASVLDYLQ